MARKKDRYEEENDLNGITFTDYDMDDEDILIGQNDFMQEENYSRKSKKKKRKKKRYLLKFSIFLLFVIAVVVFLRSDFFNIENISVSNNSFYTEEQIIEIADIRQGDNLFEFTLNSLKKKLTADPYIDTVEIKRKIPHTLEISVSERSEDIVIPYDDKFIIADYEGMVLRITDKAPEITVVNNLEPIDPEPGKALEVESTQILTDTLNMLKEVEAVNLYFKQISVSQHSVKAYIYDNLVVEGSYSYISNNLDNLSRVIEDLNKQKIKRGTIKPSGSRNYSFFPEVES